jgi:His-Xaa-Ser system protein HxsD
MNKANTESNALGNIRINEDYAVFLVNPKIYPIEQVYNAAYIMIDKAFIVLDGDPTKEILIEIRKKKEGQELKDLVREFNEELLNYSVQRNRSEDALRFRNAILQTAFLSNPENDNKTK